MKAKILIIILLLIFIMTGIVHERIVASRDKGLAEDWNANHQITGNVDMGQYSWLNQVIENRVDFPAGPVEGQVVYRSDLNQFYVYNGATWESCVMAESDQTITGNKTFSGDQIFTGDVTIDIRSGDVFELKDDYMTWIKYDFADGVMSMGKEIGGDWTEIDFYGTIGFNRTPTIINPAPVFDGDIVHKKYVDDLVEANQSQQTAVNQVNIPRDNTWRTYMTLNHTCKTGKVLVIFSCTAQPGISEILDFRIRKGGVAIDATHRETYLVPSTGSEGKSESVCVQYLDVAVGSGVITWDARVKSWGVAPADDSFIEHRIFTIIDI